MSTKGTSQADYIKQWQDLVSALAENAGDLPHLQTRLIKLQGILAQTVGVVQEQAASRAVKQEASRRLESLLSEGQKVATFLRVGVREHYGNRSEKLTEFNMLPFRSRTVPPTLPPPESPAPATEE